VTLYVYLHIGVSSKWAGGHLGSHLPARVGSFIQGLLYFRFYSWGFSQSERWWGSVIDSSKPARSRFDPGNKLLWDVFYLKTHINFFTKIRIDKSTFVLLTLQIPALGPPLSSPNWRWAGARRKGVGIVWQWLSAGQQSNLRLWRGAF